ncbi:MAG: fur1 [Planctomycetaceae bacterium]|nr:fur1 [Planctomycetaceae bacterium]
MLSVLNTASPEPNEQLNQLRDRLRSAGMRVTAPRVAVLRYLLTINRPITHKQLADQLEQEIQIDRATVFRNLVSLAKVGILKRVELGDHVWRFELVTTTESADTHHKSSHPHLLCVQCGSVLCLPPVGTEFRTFVRKVASLIGEVHEIVLKGSCRECLLKGPAQIETEDSVSE